MHIQIKCTSAARIFFFTYETRKFIPQSWQKFRKHTCWVGDGGAASIGDREVALVANLYKATELSSRCFTDVDSRSPNSNSNPAGKTSEE